MKRRRIGAYVTGGVDVFGKFKVNGAAGLMYDNAVVSGYGAYKVNSNVLYSGAAVPYVRNHNIAANATVISHKEYLGDIITSSTAGSFNIQSFQINPGLAGTFEWLAQIAMNYEQYVMEGLLFCFKSMSADALSSTNTALGTVVMATNYNPYNAAFTSKAEMEAYEFSTSFKPSDSQIHPVECSPFQTPVSELYVRATAIPSGADARLYDLGTFYIATTGFQGTSVNIGELWVTYQVALLKPKLYQALGNGNDSAYVNLGSAVNTQPQGSSQINLYNNCGLTVSSGGLCTFPIYPHPTRYLVRYIASTTSAAAAIPSIAFASLTNITLLATALYTPATGVTAQRWEVCALMQTSGNCLTSTLSLANWSGAWGTAGTNQCAFTVHQVPNDYPVSALE